MYGIEDILAALTGPAVSNAPAPGPQVPQAPAPAPQVNVVNTGPAQGSIQDQEFIQMLAGQMQDPYAAFTPQGYQQETQDLIDQQTRGSRANTLLGMGAAFLGTPDVAKGLAGASAAAGELYATPDQIRTQIGSQRQDKLRGIVGDRLSEARSQADVMKTIGEDERISDRQRTQESLAARVDALSLEPEATAFIKARIMAGSLDELRQAEFQVNPELASQYISDEERWKRETRGNTQFKRDVLTGEEWMFVNNQTLNDAQIATTARALTDASIKNQPPVSLKPLEMSDEEWAAGAEARRMSGQPSVAKRTMNPADVQKLYNWHVKQLQQGQERGGSWVPVNNQYVSNADVGYDQDNPPAGGGVVSTEARGVLGDHQGDGAAAIAEVQAKAEQLNAARGEGYSEKLIAEIRAQSGIPAPAAEPAPAVGSDNQSLIEAGAMPAAEAEAPEERKSFYESLSPSIRSGVSLMKEGFSEARDRRKVADQIIDMASRISDEMPFSERLKFRRTVNQLVRDGKMKEAQDWINANNPNFNYQHAPQ